ncbi:MAG: glycosyltransferase [Polyangiaceae bacterium]|nr:glycosyltransferase [Polyangiaceae bacterium]
MLNTALCLLYFAVLLGLSAFGLHRLHLVLLVQKHRARIKSSQIAEPISESELPKVTVQLPLFNESTVAIRLLRAVAKIDYPSHLLEIQVLDDSTDETAALTRREVERLAATGLDVVYIHRTNRVGYKAGALDEGLRVAKGDLVAIFDADFLPQPDFIRAIVPHFKNPNVGMVQTRWGHMNRDVSMLTKVQALMLDGHHLVENRARFGAGLLFNFSGTGGMWRKEAIFSAGGWQHDTLTEDLDLSYRAQLAGWRFIYREDVVSPSELPEDISALRAQQYRWAKGTVQTARKLLRRVLKSDVSFSQKVEAVFHMTPHFAYPLLVLLSILILPALVLMPATSVRTMVLVDLPLCMATTGSLAAFYMLAESAQGRSRTGALAKLPLLIAVGTGLAPHLTGAVWEGLRFMAGEFVRTPKQGNNKNRYKAALQVPAAEAFLALWSAASVAASVWTGHYFATPFAVLFALGYGYVTVLLIAEQVQRARPARVAAPALEAAAPVIALPAVEPELTAMRDSDVPDSGEVALVGASTASDAFAA